MKAVWILLAVGVLGASAFHERNHSTRGALKMTDWIIAAHGSTRVLAEGTGKDWTLKFKQTNFHFPAFAVPFAEGPDGAAGVNHRTSDNHIHIPLLGATSFGGSSEWPAGGAKKQWSPPYVWEIDGNTGEHVRLYDLSKYASCFDSVLRYTSDGYPFIAVYGGKTGQGSTPILLLDKDSDQVKKVIGDGGVEPMLLQITNTDPQQIIWASISADAGVSVTGHDVGTSVQSTSDTSTIIFGADGQTIYNNGFYNHDTGVFKFRLPIQPHLQQELFISGCNTRPWVMASDTVQRIFAVCDGNGVSGYDMHGTHQWTAQGSPVWIAMNDAETVVLTGGSGGGLSGLDASTGQLLWALNPPDFGENARVLFSGQPWAPRHPIPLADNTMAVLLLIENVHRVVVVDASTGKIRKEQATLDFYPEMLTADSSGNVYAFGHTDEDMYVAVQRKTLK